MSDDDSQIVNNFVEKQIFDFEKSVMKFSTCNILKLYYFVMKNYKRNSNQLNHCVIKMFSLIANDFKHFYIFFNIYFFELFEEILNDYNDNSLLKESKSYQEIVDFSKFIIHKFISYHINCQNNETLKFSKISSFLFLWKSIKEWNYDNNTSYKQNDNLNEIIDNESFMIKETDINTNADKLSLNLLSSLIEEALIESDLILDKEKKLECKISK